MEPCSVGVGKEQIHSDFRIAVIDLLEAFAEKLGYFRVRGIYEAPLLPLNP